PKSDLLMVGPTGCGKTLLAQTLARILDVPFCIADATALTEAGYVGEDVENILLRLIQSADYDITRAERGIVYIHEIDKIARKGDNPSTTRDVSGEGAQQALRQIIEGTLAKDDLMRILTEPRNAITKQYSKFLSLDKVELVFTQDALEAAAEKALQPKTGARGLRTIIEETLLDVMYEIPSRSDVRKCIINAETILRSKAPLLITRSERVLELE